ncbi:MAG TPA: CDP-diacylglycerol--serine O-phosphatidyltransferase, partial [Thermoanaerobaculia bacterium]|nr:CDP-diacylglycerol--serine O-phosphatidyltransferase [Thermoanaerobaculia bacterium]
LNLLFGFLSIINATRGIVAISENRFDLSAGFFERAAWMLFIAAVFDTFDGLVARGLGATTEFGKEYDSLADVVTFGCAPAVLVYAWGLHVLGNLGAGISFLFLAAVSLRLARFNVMTGKTDYRYFVGLPSPAGALTLASIVAYAPSPITSADRQFAFVILLVTAATAFAMVSPVRYRSQKGLNLQKERSIMHFMFVGLILVLAIYRPKEFFFIVAIAYLASGPLLKLWSIAFPPRKLDAEDLEPIEVP